MKAKKRNIVWLNCIVASFHAGVSSSFVVVAHRFYCILLWRSVLSDCLFVVRSFSFCLCVSCVLKIYQPFRLCIFVYYRLWLLIFLFFLFINLCFFEKLEKIISCFTFIVVFYIRKLIQKQTFEDHKFLAFFYFGKSMYIISKKKWQLNPAPTNLELPDL